MVNLIDCNAIEIKTQRNSWENVLGPPQKPWLWAEKNPECTSSAIFGVETGKLKRCADRVHSTEYNKDDSSKTVIVT